METDIKIVDMEVETADANSSGKENQGHDAGRPVSSRLSKSRGLTRPMSRSSQSRTPSRASLNSGRKTISRSSKKNRPESSASKMSEDSRGRGMESDSDLEDNKTVGASDIDFGIDITIDNGWDTDLEIEETSDSYDGSCRAVYMESCKNHGIIPASYFLRHLYDSKLDMKHHGLGATATKPLAVALVSNTAVLQLSLNDNWLGEEGGLHICEMLKENCFITHIDLSDNRLGIKFAERLIQVLATNTTISHVTLSGNDFDDKAAIFLSEAIMNTTQLQYLNLSKNKFGEKAGLVLGPAISENSSIKHLDLSWNSIRKKGAIEIAKGIKQNVLMQKINLSWNGFGNDGAQALGDALKANSSLEELDISNNRIATEGAVLLGKGIAVNETLKTVKMGKNPMQSSGCYAVCAAIIKNPNAVMELLDFTDILVNSDLKEIFQRLKEQLPNIRMSTGGDGPPKRPKAKVHPMVKLKNYIDKNNLRLVDFFNKFDKDHSMSVTREEFIQGLEETGIKLNEEEIALLLDELDTDGDGEINYSELVIGHTEFTEKEKAMSSTIFSLKGSVWQQ